MRHERAWNEGVKVGVGGMNGLKRNLGPRTHELGCPSGCGGEVSRVRTSLRHGACYGLNCDLPIHMLRLYPQCVCVWKEGLEKIMKVK